MQGVTAIDLVSGAARALKDRIEDVNKLNVFPVPDGDTGTNMSLTMDAVLEQLRGLGADADIAAVCHAITHGSLMGARGNSGVILSQILRGLCEVVGVADSFGPVTIAEALERSTQVAFQAVRKPVEGTMLTVLRDASDAATAGLHEAADPVSFMEMVVKSAFESVNRTPDLLPVLKENGVVDAGGYGLAIMAEGFFAAAQGVEVEIPDVFSAPEAAILTIEPENDWDDTEFLYCTEFLLIADQVDIGAVQDYVSSAGGSELVVGAGGTYKVHVHTDDPGAVLAYMTGIGEVAEVHVNNMRRQTLARAAELRSEAATSGAPSRRYGFCTVAAGAGLAEILRSLGADVVVSGGQTMNPSTSELLEACESVDAEQVILLPNNRNIVMAAQQAASVANRAVSVVPTNSVPQAFAALLAFDESADVDANVEAMTEAAGAVRTGEVTTAVKDTKAAVGPVKAGQVIGISEHEVVVVGEDLIEVTSQLVHLIADGAYSLTILAGEDLSEEALAALTNRLATELPDIDVESHRGDQPVYPVIIAAE